MKLDKILFQCYIDQSIFISVCVNLACGIYVSVCAYIGLMANVLVNECMCMESSYVP